MRVYRCIKLQEVINKYKNEQTKQIKNCTLNTHKYEENKEYIHFFRYNEFAKYYFNLGKDGNYEEKNDNYILFMTANIPNDILERFKGFGFYILDDEKIPIPEYAIPMEKFLNEYIVNITDKPKDLYIRDNENEEYVRYIEMIKRLKKSKKDMESIVKFLLQSNFENLLGVESDIRTEEEIENDLNLALVNLEIPKSIDDEIIEIKRKVIK